VRRSFHCPCPETSSSSTGLVWGKPGPAPHSYAASVARVQRRALQLTRAAMTTSQVASRASLRASGTTSTPSPRSSPVSGASGSTTRAQRVWRGMPPRRAPGLSCLLPSAPAPTGFITAFSLYPFRTSSPLVGIASPTSLRRCRHRPTRRRNRPAPPSLPPPRRRRRRRQRTSPSTPAFAPPIPTPSNAFARPTFRRLTASARRAPSRRRRSPSEIA
jgi:hypothetical protein